MFRKSIQAVILMASVCAFASVDVQIGSTQVIAPQQLWSTCPKGSIMEFQDGSIQVMARVYIKKSIDNGLTWFDGTTWFSSYTYSYPNSGAINFYGAVIATNEPGLYLSTMLISDDDGQSAIVIPTEIILDGQWEGVIASSHSQIIELDNGVLLTAMYGKRLTDSTTQAFALISEDWGDSWHYYSTIAHDDENMPGGFNESDLLLMPDGRIHCFVRSESSPSPNLYLSTSYDGGQSWSEYEQIFDKAASPHAILMTNGIIVVATGRPGNWLLFSDDGGYSWNDAVEYYTGPLPPDCANYTSLVETNENEILVVYTRTDASDNTLSEVAGTFVTVTDILTAADADIDNDGIVDWADLSLIADSWLSEN